MKKALMFAATVSALMLAACNQEDKGAASSTQTSEAKDAAGTKTIASGIDQNSKFYAALKASGLDATFAGPGPYTLLAPDDAAFAKLPAGTVDGLMKPEQRAQLTGLLTNHVFSGTVLADDIGKAIDAGKGKAMMATMGGGMLTATRDGGKIVLTDAAGGKATVTQADDKFSNGVVHHIDGVLMPKTPS